MWNGTKKKRKTPRVLFHGRFTNCALFNNISTRGTKPKTFLQIKEKLVFLVYNVGN